MADTWEEKAEKWLWDSCGYAPDDSVKELAELMEKAENWDAHRELIKDSTLFVVKPEYANMSRGDMASKLQTIGEVLIPKWREEVKEYPDTVKGLHARAAVDICRKELEEIVEAEG